LAIFDIFLQEGAKVMKWYPPYPFVGTLQSLVYFSGDKRPALAYIGTDYVFTASTRWAAKGLVKNNGNNPVYLYQVEFQW